jgi:hypothetical protein
MVLGHEAAGTAVETRAEVRHIAVGDGGMSVHHRSQTRPVAHVLARDLIGADFRRRQQTSV